MSLEFGRSFDRRNIGGWRKGFCHATHYGADISYLQPVFHLFSLGLEPGGTHDRGANCIRPIVGRRRAAIITMLRSHPHLRELLLKDRPAQASEGEWIFLQAAAWPDHVRPPHFQTHEPVCSHSIYRFHHATWHYANFEYRAGQRESSLPNQPLPPHPMPSNPVERTDVIEQLDLSYMIIRGKDREHSEPEIEFSPHEIRAIRLCWLMHLIGDIHQPLHVATLVDPQILLLQHGDEGGNKLAVRINQTSGPKKLHAVWDDLLGTNSHFTMSCKLPKNFARSASGREQPT